MTRKGSRLDTNTVLSSKLTAGMSRAKVFQSQLNPPSPLERFPAIGPVGIICQGQGGVLGLRGSHQMALVADEWCLHHRDAHTMPALAIQPTPVSNAARHRHMGLGRRVLRWEPYHGGDGCLRARVDVCVKVSLCCSWACTQRRPVHWRRMERKMLAIL